MEYNFNTFNGRIYTHSDIMEHYSNIVPFLGIALGEMHEVALLDCRTKHLIAIANGHISGRNVGDPMTNLACDIVEREIGGTPTLLPITPVFHPKESFCVLLHIS